MLRFICHIYFRKLMFGVINIPFQGLLNLVFTGGDRGYFLDVGGVGKN